MIVCHAHRYIFVKTRKTAGTSVEIALAKFCGPNDVITRDTPADQEIRAALGHPGPQNEYGVGFRHYVLGDWRRLLTRGVRARFKNHMPARRIRAIVGERIWASYFKFTIERDQWDKAVSLYYWRTRAMEPRPTLLEFLQSANRHSISNFDVYAIDGRVAVDRVIRYESLERELEDVRTQLGLPEPIALPRAKGQHRPRDADARALIGSGEKDIIDRVCAREIAAFGYRFEAARSGA
jgi:hypothetical protein